jgi:hypothetical protein
MKKISFFFKILIRLHIYFFIEELKKIYSKLLLIKNNKNKKKYLLSHTLKKYIRNSHSSEKILITSFLNLPEYLQYEYIIGVYLSNILNLDIEILLKKDDVGSKIFFENLGHKKFIYYDEVNFFKRYLNLIKSALIVFKKKNVSEFINIKFQNLPIGKNVFSHYSRSTGIPTLKKIDALLIFYFSKYLNFFLSFKKVLSKYNIKHLIQSETQFVPAAVCYGLSLKNRINVYSRLGVKKISVRKVSNIKQISENRSHFNSQIIKILSKEKKKNLLIKKGLNIVKNRFNSVNYPSDIDEELFKLNLLKNKNHIFKFSKFEICKLFNWDNKKPIGIILANDLTDGLFISKKNMFQDNYTWLIETIERAKKNKNINWLIKPHPREIKNQVTMKTSYLVSKIEESNIKLLPERYFLKSLPKIVDIVFTDHGSAGYEYPALGIPAVTTSETIYHGLNISIEMNSKKKYFNFIDNIHLNFKNLKFSIENSRLFAFLYSSFANIDCPASDLIEFGDNVFLKKCWQVVEKNFFKFNKKNKNDLQKDIFYKSLKLQIKKNSKHTLNIQVLKSLQKNY